MATKPITRKKALRLAVQALEAQRQHLAVDANMHDLYKADYPAAINASKKRAELNQAIDFLNDISKGLS